MAKKPNSLTPQGDAGGARNVSPFSRGMMGERTPHVDRVDGESPAAPARASAPR